MMKNVNLHWTTVVTEKFMLVSYWHTYYRIPGMDVYDMFLARNIELADPALLFIHTEIVGMVGAYFANNRITCVASHYYCYYCFV